MSSQPNADELQRIATDAYLYLYPLVLMEVTRGVMTNHAYGEKIARGPMGTLVHTRSFPPGNFKTVVRPNFDTLYSTAWLDLSTEPYVVSIPAIADRFFMLPIYDMWTEIFASPGTRTHGDGPLTFALCEKSWRGDLPDGVVRIDAPTPIVWLIGRTETRGPDDYLAVHEIQDQMHLAPLSTWPDVVPTAFVEDRDIDMTTPPLAQVENLSAEAYFALASELLAKNAPHHTDWGILARMARVGFVVGEHFDLNRVESDVRSAFEGAKTSAARQMRERFATISPVVNGWSTIGDLGVWGNAYLKRAMIAIFGLGANPPEESIYPNLQRDEHGEALNGARRYAVRFDADQLPPVDAFWSLSVYDTRGYQVENEIDRFALGDRDELLYELDGSLELVLAHERPSKEWVANWLPVPEGAFVVTMRLYLPQESALNGTWNPPPARRLD
jgi:hypothetical protein